MAHAELEELIGKTLTSVKQVNGRDGDELVFTTEEGDEYVLYHDQDCCEVSTLTTS